MAKPKLDEKCATLLDRLKSKQNGGNMSMVALGPSEMNLYSQIKKGGSLPSAPGDTEKPLMTPWIIVLSKMAVRCGFTAVPMPGVGMLVTATVNDVFLVVVSLAEMANAKHQLLLLLLLLLLLTVAVRKD